MLQWLGCCVLRNESTQLWVKENESPEKGKTLLQQH